MKIGKFVNNARESVGAVHDKYWVDLPELMEHFGQKIENPELTFFLQMDREELAELESKIKEAFNQEETRVKLFHELKENSYLPPIPNVPRLFTQRGNGSIFARIGKMKKPKQPVFELRYPQNLRGHNCKAILPEDYKGGGWNIEMVAVIGKPGENIREEDVFKHVAGYTTIIDHSCAVTSGTFQNEWFVEPEERDMTYNFYLGCFNGNVVLPTPIGPWITTSDEIDDPHNLWVTEKEKSGLVGKIHTSSMTFHFPEVISFMSKFITLLPGDMISSASIGYDGYGHWDQYDEDAYVEVEIEKIGKLRMKIEDQRGKK